jgi:CRP-like cAMP-binding protein
MESGSGSGVPRGTNRLLDALPAADSRRLTGSLSPVFVDATTVLFEPDEPIGVVHFPLSAVVSLVTPLNDGAIIEVATVGNEGIVGVPLVPGGSLAVRAVASVAGWTLPMDAPTFLDEVGHDGPLRELANKYVQALFGQISQAAACNALHTNLQRLSRWLLMSNDRVGTSEFAITHEFVGRVLGVRPATVTLSARILQTAGFISYDDGRVTILDRAGLESTACECYRVIKAELARSFSGQHQVPAGHAAHP